MLPNILIDFTHIFRERMTMWLKINPKKLNF